MASEGTLTKSASNNNIKHLSLTVTARHSDNRFLLDAGIEAGTPEEPSRLMSLPQELRDEIYDQLTHNFDITPPKTVEPKQQQWPKQISMKSGPLPSLLRVSRQFSDEYKQRILSMATLAIIDDCTERRPSETPSASLANAMQFTRHVELHRLSRGVFNLRASLERSLEWVVRLKALSSGGLDLHVVIKIGDTTSKLSYPELLVDALSTQLLGALIGLRGMKSVEVRLSGSQSGAPNAPPHTVYGKWTERQGWISESLEKAEGDKELKGATKQPQ